MALDDTMYRHFIKQALVAGIIIGGFLGIVEAIEVIQQNLIVLYRFRNLIYFIYIPLVSSILLTICMMIFISAILYIIILLKGYRLSQQKLFALHVSSGLILVLILKGFFFINDIYASFSRAGIVRMAQLLTLILVTIALAALAIAFSVIVFRFIDTREPMGLARSNGRLMAAFLAMLIVLMPFALYFSAHEGLRIFESAKGADSNRSDSQPNVLLIVIDTLRQDRLSYYGCSSVPTASMDRLAQESLTFERAYTCCPWTLPAVASILTGLYPQVHSCGISVNSFNPYTKTPLSDKAETLAEYMKKAGYFTKAVVTNPYTATEFNLDQGFDSYMNLTTSAEAYMAYRGILLVRIIDSFTKANPLSDTAERLTDIAIDWLTDNKDSRFFLWLHYLDPHAPYCALTAKVKTSFRYDTLLVNKGANKVATENRGSNIGDIFSDMARLRSGEIRLSDADKQRIRDLYDQEVIRTDDSLGRLFRHLQSLGLMQNTIIVLCSDHGEEFWEHGGVEHGHTHYDELLRVPFSIYAPWALPSGLDDESIACITDIMPTILSLCDIDYDAEKLQGFNLADHAQRALTSKRAIISQNILLAEDGEAIIKENHKLVVWSYGFNELFYLAGDPRELINLYSEGEISSKYASALQEQHEINRKLSIGLGIPLGIKSAPLSIQTKSALRSLGYTH